MRYLLLIILLATVLLSAAKIKKIEGAYTYQWGETETVVDAREQCRKLALNDAVSSYATYIESNIVVENYTMKKDVITSVALGLAKNIVIIEKKEDKTTSTVSIKLSCDLDEDEVVAMLKKKADDSGSGKKISDFIKLAIDAESEGRVGDALKYYYWSLALYGVEKNQQAVKIPEFNGNNPTAAIPDRINKIFAKIIFNIQSVTTENGVKTAILNINYGSEPVQNLEFCYYQGDGWSNIISAKDGLADIELTGAALNLTKISVKVEFAYKDKARFDNYLSEVLAKSNYAFERCTFSVDLSKTAAVVKPSTGKITALADREENKIELLQNKDLYQNIVYKIIAAIKSKNYASVENLFTASGFKTFNSLITYGNAKVLVDKPDLKVGKSSGGVIVRSVPMSFAFAKNNRKFTEDVVFTLTENGKVDHVSFSLGRKAVTDLLGKDNKFASYEEKLQILEFMENYKTAYCLKDYNFLNAVFAENALIIVGKILKTGENIGEMYNRLGAKKVEYVKLNKSQFMDNLKKSFAGNEFININFETSDLKKVKPDRDVYAIQISQNYYSSVYADQGYLFLMIDLENKDLPKIQVRSWQPEKNADGTIIGCEDFNF